MSHQPAFETARPSPQEPPTPATHAPRLLGQYLVDIGAITSSDVDEAIELMRLCNSPLGEMAVGEGVLSSAQLDMLLREQRLIDGHFSELAVALGMGDRVGACLEALSVEQTAENLRFGDALVELGVLSSTALEAHVEHYDAQSESADDPAATLRPSVSAALDLLPRLARRWMRSAVCVGAPRRWDGHGWETHATASFSGPHGVALGLSVECHVAAALSHNFDPEKTAWQRQLSPILLADFAGMTAEMVRGKIDPAALEHSAVHLRVGELPRTGLCFDLAFEAGRGVLVLESPGT